MKWEKLTNGDYELKCDIIDVISLLENQKDYRLTQAQFNKYFSYLRDYIIDTEIIKGSVIGLEENKIILVDTFKENKLKDWVKNKSYDVEELL